MHVEPEAEYTDAACVPYTASALAIGEESIYAAFGVDLSRSGRGEEWLAIRHPRSPPAVSEVQHWTSREFIAHGRESVSKQQLRD